KIQALKLPEEVAEIGVRAFQGCSGLVRIEVEEANTHFVSVESVLYTKDLTRLLRYPSKKETPLYNVLQGVKEIEEFAFENANDLIAVKLPSGLLTIPEYAFFNCENLQKASVPSTVRQMGEGSFFGSPALEHQALPGGVDFIEFDPDKGLISDLE
ncbi:MAG: leucine-rich repeat domain-containing protein, partial [Bacteroidales bacterium]|nr:leucine-rich repeat domain-containing protein [Bacteroidales bacterium]